MERKLTFSQRLGYTLVSEVIIREQVPDSIINAFINCIKTSQLNDTDFERAEQYVWRYLFEKTLDTYRSNLTYVYLKIEKHNWHEKLSYIDFMIYGLRQTDFNHKYSLIDNFIKELNQEFERLNFAYRFIDNVIVEVTSNEEVESIENAIQVNIAGVKTHLKTALGFLSPVAPDYRNSAKESISAVGALCRDITGESTLGEAIKKLEKNGITLLPQQKQGLINIYNHSNDPKTGIRHELVEEGYATTQEDAIYILVMCSAFINYINAKRAK